MTNNLLEKYVSFKANNPDKRIRDAAIQLGVSEAELVACQIGSSVIRLNNNAEEILSDIEPFGEVMALTRNGACVHERKGVYESPKFHKMGKMNIGLFVNPDIDLRLFMDHWAHIFAVSEDTKVGLRRSIQFFDKSGTAIHKIYLTNHSNEAYFDELIAKYQSDDQSTKIETTSYPEKEVDKPDCDIDWAGFRNAWENLKDTHEFFPMLKKFKVGRLQAFRNVKDEFAVEVGNNGTRRAMELASKAGTEIMVFVGNRGCIQIHTGPVNKLVDHGPWFNVLDPKFNLHLNEDQIAETWVTRKPTEDGIVTSVEVFDADGEIIASLFGKRKPGDPELEAWRDIVNQIPVKATADAA